MEVKSTRIEMIEAYRNTLIAALNKNAQQNTENYLHKKYLTNKYTPDMTWSNAEILQSVLSAVEVTLGASTPLMRNGKISLASGKISKYSLAYRLDEDAITQLNIMVRAGRGMQEFAKALLDNTVRCVKGIDVRNEINLRQALSTGTISTPIDDAEQGIGVEVNFGYKADNKVKPAKAWSDTTADTIADIEKMLDKARDNNAPIHTLFISEAQLRQIRNSDAGKKLGAREMGLIGTTDALLSVRQSTMVQALQNEFGINVEVVSGSYSIQKKDGDIVTVNPWKAGMLIGVPEATIGNLFYGTLAEEDSPASHVTYSKVGDYTLISHWANNNPVEEFTQGQALCLPVINNASKIVYMDASSTK